MSQATIRYFGVTLEDAQDSERTDARLGRFVATPDPMPVGTSLLVDETLHIVTRVEEGTTSGVWLWSEGMVVPTSAPVLPAVTAPTPIDDIPTAPMTPPVAAAAEPVPEPDTPEAITDGSSGKTDDPKRKRRRPAKTIIGR